jgi:hypothetical protein
MPQVKRFATEGDIHYDVPLSRFASAAFADASDPASGLIADQVFPEIGVGKQSDFYYILNPDDFMRASDAERAPGTRANRIEFSVATSNYFAKNYALANETPLEDMVNADAPVQMRENSTNLIVSDLKLGQEVRVANLVTSISNVGSGVALSGATAWSALSSSTPIADASTARGFIRSRTGLTPNTAIMDDATFEILRQHPDLLDLYKYTSGGTVSEEEIARAFRVNRILVAGAVQNTANEGSAFVGANVWSNVCLFAHIGPATGLKSRTLGGRFSWRHPSFPANFGVKRTVMDEAGSEHVEVVEAGHYQDEQVIARDLGFLYTGTI